MGWCSPPPLLTPCLRENAEGPFMFVQSTFEAARHRAIRLTCWVVEGGPCHPRYSGEGTPLS